MHLALRHNLYKPPTGDVQIFLYVRGNKACVVRPQSLFLIPEIRNLPLALPLLL